MDDFSFPTVPASQEPLCQVPFPLWFVSSIADQKTVHHRRRSFSSAEEAAKIADALETASPAISEGGRYHFLDDEERMDMLWEDFNEELCRPSCDHRRGPVNGEVSSDSTSSRHGRMDRHCVRSSAKSKTGSIIHHRRPSLLLMLKVLKKLFLIQKTSSSKRKPLH
ncbi:putative Glutamate-1-semialdehyde 2,1-aminomutase 1 [Cocos nucifera]|uniref:Putative Glutamate-1-semialdehyde 2,1-aminomutase 1 n=1 Tax=Cocos nucifera TaxID=13894 RepID=A0A8K0IYJ4_COCNU|nr:putative Glutamate-1-semialdehyde 2,1-aminomutase 1 [Cocos nucifera]